MNTSLRFCVILLGLAAASARAAEADVSTRAFLGKPFGVAEVTVRFKAGSLPAWYADQEARVIAERGAAFYPAWSTELASPPSLQSLRMYFLFTGRQERTVQIAAAGVHRATISPTENQVEHAKLLREWWSVYNRPLDAESESVPTAEVGNYLRHMLARRLKLDKAVRVTAVTPLEMVSPETLVNDQLGLWIGSVSIRAALQNERLLATNDLVERADQPLPKPTAPPPIAIPENVPPNVAVEPIALRTPAECFYVRCKRFADYLWLREMVNAWGGSVDNLVGQESFDYGVRAGVERRLALAPDAATREKLDAAISDLAVIGTDLFFRDGPSVGVLFEAKTDDVAVVIRRQRDAVLAEPGATERDVSLGGESAKLLTTADGSVRSFYAVRGKYHLVTTSSWITRRFCECAAGGDSLGRLNEFRYARFKMPLNRDDEAFIYLSDPFFRTLVGPAYRVEMTRRAKALVDVRLAEAARLAAAAEGLNPTSVAELRDAGFLPPNFGPRADGAAAELVGGTVRDSLRGVAGGFLPIPDVAAQGLTKSEVDGYQRFSLEYEQQWRRMDPVTLGIQRRRDNRGREVVALDFIIAPYATAHYGFLPAFLRTSKQRLQPPADTTVYVAVTSSSFVDPGRSVTYFAGLKDVDAPVRLERGAMVAEPVDPNWFHRLELPFAGFGSSHSASLEELRRILVEFGQWRLGRANLEGYFKGEPKNNPQPYLPAELWGRSQKHLEIFGLSRKDLEAVSPALKLVDAERPAQIRIRIQDLQATKIGRVIDTASYIHSRRISATNARLMQQFEQQFAVPTEQIPAAAMRVVGGRPKCPLGGELTLRADGPQPQTWCSTAWETISRDEVTRVPRDYHFTLLRLLEKVEIEFQIDATTLTTHVELTLDP